MVRRRETRVRTVLPVRVFGMDSNGKPFTELTHTLDITNRGARIAGFQHSVKVGDVVGLQRGTDKARYRVAWVGEPQSRAAGQVGLECVQENKNIWNVVFEDGGPDTFDLSSLRLPVSQPFPTASESVTGPQLSQLHPKEQPERRQHRRHPCDVGVEIQLEGSDVGIFARCTDISRGGCYIETRSPFPPEARVFICFKTQNATFRALGVVRSSHASLGMGVKFEELGEDDSLFLEDLLQTLEPGNTPPPTTGLVSRIRECVQALQRLHEQINSSPPGQHATQTFRILVEVILGALQTSSKNLERSWPEQPESNALEQHLLRSLPKLAQAVEAEILPGSLEDRHLIALQTALGSLLRKLSTATSLAPRGLHSMPGPPRTM